VWYTILPSSLSLASVFLPVLFMGVIIGRLFHEFAVTIGAAILVSGVVALTLTPMLCSRFLRAAGREQHGRLYQASERVYEKTLRWYERSLEWVMQRRPAALAFSIAILAATVVLFAVTPKGFLPSEDNAQIFGITETVQGTSFDDMVAHQQQVMAVLQQEPGVTGVMSFLGGGTINQGRVFLQLKRRSQRKMSVDQIIGAYGSGQVSTIYTPTNQYWVVMELLPDYQRDLSALSLLYIRSRTGPLVPLASLAGITSTVGPLTVNHSGQLPSVTISFDLQPNVSLGTAVAAVQRVARQVLPSSVTTSFGGTAQAFQSSQTGLVFLLILAVLVIYLVLGILYESFIHPLTILSALPFAGFGALVTLLLFRIELSVYAFVGIIMLVGLVKKNGIMMIDFALEAQRIEGKSPTEAILQ